MQAGVRINEKGFEDETMKHWKNLGRNEFIIRLSFHYIFFT